VCVCLREYSEPQPSTLSCACVRACMWGKGWCVGVYVCVGTYMCKQTRKWQVNMTIKNARFETRYNVTNYENSGSSLTQKQHHRSMRQSKCNAVPCTPQSHVEERYYKSTHSYTWPYMSVYGQLRVPSEVGEMMIDRPEKEVLTLKIRCDLLTV
jgi:hypothetical protein